MIGQAIYDLLSTHPAITALVENRISPVAFPEAVSTARGAFPALCYNTQGVKSLGCRAGDSGKTGVLEIGILANNTVSLETIADTLTDVLDGYDGIHAGYALSLTASNDEFDERVEDLKAYYKALQFDFLASKQA